MEPRKLESFGADVVSLTEGNMDGRAIASDRPTGVSKTLACVEALLRGNRTSYQWSRTNLAA